MVWLKKLVGLTGKTGAGKSTVSAYLKEKGAYVIDGDVVARRVFSEDKSLIEKLVNAFGNVLNDDGTLNRSGLAKKAFASPENTDWSAETTERYGSHPAAEPAEG